MIGTGNKRADSGFGKHNHVRILRDGNMSKDRNLAGLLLLWHQAFCLRIMYPISNITYKTPMTMRLPPPRVLSLLLLPLPQLRYHLAPHSDNQSNGLRLLLLNSLSFSFRDSDCRLRGNRRAYDRVHRHNGQEIRYTVPLCIITNIWTRLLCRYWLSLGRLRLRLWLGSELWNWFWKW